MSPAEGGRGPGELEAAEPTHRPWLGTVLVAGMAAALATALFAIPREHAPLPAIARYALEVALPQWKLTEPVNEVVYGTRGFDTFGETFLLLAAVISVVMITRSREGRRGYFGESAAGAREQEETDPAAGAGTSGDSGARGSQEDAREKGGEDDAAEAMARSAEQREQSEDEPPDRPPETPDAEALGTPAPETAEAMTVVTRTAIRIAAPVLAVAGLYLVAWGYSPGGGFPGGAVILGVILLAYAGFGRPRVSRVVRPALLENLEMAGAAAIIMTELLGLVLKGSFSANCLPLAAPQTILSGGVAQLFSASELIEVGTGLTIAVFALLGMGHDWAPDKASKPDDGNSDPKEQNAGHGSTGHGSTGR